MVSKRFVVMLVTVAVLVAAVLSSFGTIMVTEYVAAKNGDRTTLSAADFAAWNQYQELENVKTMIDERYYGEYDSDVLITGAAKGMVEALDDPYSAYMTPEEFTRYNESNDGAYGGIGLLVTTDPDDNLIVVLQVFKESPSEAAGVKIGDKIIGVNDEDVTGLDMSAVTSLMRGEIDTSVKLTVRRGGESIDFDLIRKKIVTDKAEYRMIGDVGYIYLYEFTGNGSELVEKGLAELKKQGAKGIILDLRNNPGGLLTQAVDVANLFVPSGPIVNFMDNQGKKRSEMANSKQLNMPLAVLTNEYSASASELVAGCIKDYGTGTIVGTKTFGKGIVQTTFPINSGAALKLTTQQFFTPQGNTIHKVGIEPDIECEQDPELVANPELLTDENDVQLKRAIEIIHEEIQNAGE